MTTQPRSIEADVTSSSLERALREAPVRRHVLDLDDFSAQEINLVLDAASAMKEVLARDIKKVPTLRGKVIVTLFYESSTRTRISFEEAGKVLSADVINMSASGSSVEKGETLLNTSLTLQAMGVDVLVVRHPHSGAPHFMARHLTTASVVNAGDGLHAHPSQALLDLFTVRERLGGIAGRKVVIVGDILHSRVARSDIWGFIRMGASVVLSGPPTLIPSEMLPGPAGDPAAPMDVEDPASIGTGSSTGDDYLLGRVTVETDLDRAIEGADVVIALRLQLERQAGGAFPTVREYSRLWGLNERRLGRAQKHCLVMHPGPMNEGIEISPAVSHGARSVIERQVTNGVAVRMALLYLLAATPRRAR